MLHPSIIWMVFGVWTLSVKSQVTVQSPNISTFGTWQPWARCPEGQYANGMRIKFEEWSDDVEIAGLTAVDLRCATKGGPNSEESVISGEGDSGKWQDVQYCPDDKVIVGFALKVEESQGSYDDAGALNFAAFCGAQFGARNNKVALEGDTKSVTRGHWTEDLFCPSGFAVCGIQARVEKNETQAGIDDTGVNNVQVECCPAPYDCDASYEAKEVEKYQNNYDYETSHKVLAKSKYEGPAAAEKTEQEFVAKKIMLALKKKYEQLEFNTAPMDFVYTRNKRFSIDSALPLPPPYSPSPPSPPPPPPPPRRPDPVFQRTTEDPNEDDNRGESEEMATTESGSEMILFETVTEAEAHTQEVEAITEAPAEASEQVTEASEGESMATEDSNQAPVDPIYTEAPAEGSQESSDAPVFIPEDGLMHSTEAPFEVAATEVSEVTDVPVPEPTDEVPGPRDPEPAPIPGPEELTPGPEDLATTEGVPVLEPEDRTPGAEEPAVTEEVPTPEVPEPTDEVPGPWVPEPAPVPEVFATTEGIPTPGPEEPAPGPVDPVPGPEDPTPGPVDQAETEEVPTSEVPEPTDEAPGPWEPEPAPVPGPEDPTPGSAVTEEVPEEPESTAEPPTSTDAPTPAPAPGPGPESQSNYHRLSISMDELEVLVQQAVAGQNMVITLPVPAHKQLIVEQIVVKCDEHVISLPALIVKHR